MRFIWLLLLLMPTFSLANGNNFTEEAFRIRGLDNLTDNTPSPHTGTSETSLSEKLKVVPRTVFYVPNLLLKGAFHPIVTTMEWAEKNAVPEHVIDFLFNDERSLGVLPVISYSSSDGWAGGVQLLSLKTLGNWGEVAKLKLKYAEEEYHSYEFSFSDKRVFNRPFYYGLKLKREADPSRRFEGIGFSGEKPLSGAPFDPLDANVESRFSQNRDMIHWRSGYRFSSPTGSSLETGLIFVYNKRKSGEKANVHGDDPSIGDIYNTSSLVGFNETIETSEIFWEGRFESVTHPGQPTDGWTLELFGGGSPFSDRFQFWHYGGEVTHYTPIYRGNRVLLSRLALEGVDGASNEIPFTSLPTLGGAGRMRGFDKNIFRDEKLGIATLEYHYPIHHNVLGEIFFDAGTLSSELNDLGKKWKVGYGFGFLIGSKSDLKLKIDIASGEGDFEVFVSTDVTRAFSNWSERL